MQDQSIKSRVITYSRLTNFLEYYDFSLYVLLSPILGKIFFDAADNLSAIIYGYITLAVTFFIRPIGGIILGMIGDKKGKLFVLNNTMLIMTVATFSLAFLPGYSQIGVIATIMLLILRSAQCFALAGEYVAAVVISAEQSENLGNKRSIANLVTLGTLGWLSGAVVANIVLFFTNAYEAYYEMIWRAAFFMGGILSATIYYQRTKIAGIATSADLELHDVTKWGKTPLSLKKFKYYVATTLFAGWNGTLFYGLFIYPPVHESISLFGGKLMSVNYTISCMVFFAILMLLLGRIMQFMNNTIHFLHLLFTPFAVLLVYVLITKYGGIVALLGGAALAAYFTAFVMVWTNSVIPHFFEDSTRFKSMAIFYNLGLAMFGGTAPMICTYLQKNYGHFSPFIYLALFSVCSAIITISVSQSIFRKASS